MPFNCSNNRGRKIPRGRIGLNYLSKFVCTQWAV